MAIASWGTLDRVPMFALTVGTLVQRLGITPPPKGMPGPLSRPTPEDLSALLEGGGFSNVEVEEPEVVFDYESPEEFVTCLRDIAPPITALLKEHPPEVQEQGWTAITEAAREKAGGDNPFQLSNQALLASGDA
jgi:hypothetical protein